MRLDQIKLSGFKSFAEPTTFQLPGQRVGVVGPNGCGKSDIMDAVRWVLGESKASELRGESMQDVIFNGSGQRKPAWSLNSLRDGANSNLRYIEITNINHFGVFGQFDAKYVPLAYYEAQALDMMWNHLKGGATLPPHQLVRTTSRGGEPGKAPPIDLANLPPIRMQPTAGNRVSIDRGKVVLPD